MQKLFLPLAALLHEGNTLNLAKLLLGHIFEELGQFVNCFRINYLISTGALSAFSSFGSMPFLRILTNSTLKAFDWLTSSQIFQNLNRMKTDFGLFFSFSTPVKMFAMRTSILPPFLRRNCGPAWLERLLFPNDTEWSKLANRSWANLLAVQVIPTGLPQHKKERFKVTLYAPHYAAKQLGFSQAIPTPLPRNSKLFCHITLASKKELDICLSKNQQQREGYNHLLQPSSESSSDDSEPSIQNLLAASSHSDDTIDSDSSSQLIRRQRPVPVAPDSDSVSETIVPDSDSPSQIPETIPSPQRTSSPSKHDELQTSPGLGSGDLCMFTESTNADLVTLVTILNQAVQEDKVLISTPALIGPSTSGLPSELNVNAREQLLSLLKLLDHPPIKWTNDAALNKLFSDVLSLSLELQVPSQYSAIVNHFIKVFNRSVTT
ncbi:hypothetical protein Ahy_B02g061516 [Arachis hypogaea]|uniref:Uncharacterized protein n=1 Tax=Arachis hypogaea TaxID=3818 RepID=A0A445ALF0_ARAHY|nr:hypothetical protein Ahy_B02g061516 [Arachis hypogaea]